MPSSSNTTNNKSKDNDINVEEENVDVAFDQPRDTDTSTNISSGLQQIEEGNTNLSPPPSAPRLSDLSSYQSRRSTNNNTLSSGLQLNADDDDDQPLPSMAEDTNEMIRSSLESINSNDNHSPPTPFKQQAEFEEDTIAKKIAKHEKMNQKPAAANTNTDDEDEDDILPPPLDRDSIYEPSAVIEGGEVLDNTNTGKGDANRRGWEGIESRAARRDIESQTRTNNNDTAGSINDVSVVEEEASQEDIHIPVAWKVDNNDDEDDGRMRYMMQLLSSQLYLGGNNDGLRSSLVWLLSLLVHWQLLWEYRYRHHPIILHHKQPMHHHLHPLISHMNVFVKKMVDMREFFMMQFVHMFDKTVPIMKNVSPPKRMAGR